MSWRILLFPFAILYDLITRIRNQLYDNGLFSSHSFSIPIILVGNLSVGGTGKTPMVDFLIRYLRSKGLSVVTLSRGYGRTTKGFRVVNDHDTASTVGDEPMTYFEKYGDHITVTVGESRVTAVQNILRLFKNADVILLDDAFQHRALKAGLNIVLTKQSKPFWKDFVLPAGDLREARKGISRSQALVVTKSTVVDYPAYLKSLRKPVFFTNIRYKEPVFIFNPITFSEVILVAGLADNSAFVTYASANYKVIRQLANSDHYTYQEKDIVEMTANIQKHQVILTTHKDVVKLKEFEMLKSYSLAYLPIETYFLKEQEHFLHLIDNYLSSASGNH